MGPINFSGLIYFGIAIGIVMAVLLAAAGYGVWWLLSHLAWV